MYFPFRELRLRHANWTTESCEHTVGRASYGVLMLQPDRETGAEWTKTVTAFAEDFIDEKHDLAGHLRAELAGIEGIELLPSDLTVVVFRSVDSEQLLKSINDSGKLFVSSTWLGG